MSMRLAPALGLTLLAISALSGCQTTAKDSDAAVAKPPRIGTPMPFQPAQTTAFLQYGSGPYPTLYDGASSCTMLIPAPPVAAPPAAPEPAPVPSDSNLDAAAGDPEMVVTQVPPPPSAGALSDGSLVFQCKLKSTFEDTSIAYDAAGLRGIHAYLLLPDGTQVQPIETVLDPTLIDEAQGALRSYTRTVSMLFPRVPISMPTPEPGVPATGLRLVLEGFGAMFFFEWPPVLPATVRPEPFLKSDTYENVKKGYNKTRDWTRETVHTFD